MRTESEADFSADQQSQAENKLKPKKESKSIEKKNSKFNRLLQKIGFALLFFMLGALIVSLFLYLPARSNLNEAQAELDRLLPMEAEFEAASIRADIYKILNNVNNMRIALIANDSDRASQYAQYIEDDLAELSISEMEDITASLANQFSKLSASINSDPDGTIDGLRDFQNDLLTLSDNLN